MIIFKKPSKLIEKIKDLKSEKNFHVISIDGFSGSGKSYLSKMIVRSNNYSYVDIDEEYLISSDDGRYIDFVKYEKLRSDINSLISKNNVIVVDGICILEILKRVGVKSDIKVYVKFIGHHGKWGAEYLDYSTTVEDALSNRRNENQEFECIAAGIEGRDPLIFDKCREDMVDETIRYHYSNKPDKSADLIFERKQEQQI